MFSAVQPQLKRHPGELLASLAAGDSRCFPLPALMTNGSSGVCGGMSGDMDATLDTYSFRGCDMRVCNRTGNNERFIHTLDLKRAHSSDVAL